MAMLPSDSERLGQLPGNLTVPIKTPLAGWEDKPFRLKTMRQNADKTCLNSAPVESRMKW